MKTRDVATTAAGILLIAGQGLIRELVGSDLRVMSLLLLLLGLLLTTRGVLLLVFAALETRDRSRQPHLHESRGGMPSIACPVCHQPSDSVKRHGMANVVFLGVYIWAQRVNHTGCPACMRRQIGNHVTSLANVLGGNLMWPFFVAIPGAIQLISTFRRGHSKAVRRLLEAEPAVRR
jgi:hypothetical protein